MEALHTVANWIAAPLSFAFMQRALIGVLLVCVICAVLGTIIVLQNLSFIGEGLAHGALPGIAVGYAMKQNLYLTALAFSVLLGVIIAFLRERGRVASDAAVAIAFSTASAAGIALVSAVRFGGADLNSFLFGNVLAVGQTDLQILAAAAVLLGLLFFGLLKELAYATFDPESAAAAGVPVRFLNYLFLIMVAVAVVVSLQSVGLILVTSLLVMPAAAARQWVERLGSMIGLAALFGVIAALAGLYGSFYLRLPSGATIVLSAAIIFLISLIARGIRSRLAEER